MNPFGTSDNTAALPPSYGGLASQPYQNWPQLRGVLTPTLKMPMTAAELKKQVSERRKRLEAELVRVAQFESWLNTHDLTDSIVSELQNAMY